MQTRKAEGQRKKASGDRTEKDGKIGRKRVNTRIFLDIVHYTLYDYLAFLSEEIKGADPACFRCLLRVLSARGRLMGAVRGRIREYVQAMRLWKDSNVGKGLFAYGFFRRKSRGYSYTFIQEM